MLYAIVAVVAIIIDQWVKYWVAGHIALNTGTAGLIPGIVSLVNIHNDGAAFSFLSGGGARIYFIILCGVFTVAVIIALATRMISGSLGRWCAVMVVAGGIGNCIDRILYGYVQDMFKLDFFPSFAVFNVADIFITVFCILFIFYVLFGTGKKDEDDDEEELEDDEEEEEEVKPKKQRKERKAEHRSRKEEREELDEEEAPKPRKRVKEVAAEEPAPSRKARQAKYDDEYEQYKAAKAMRQRGAETAQPVRKAEPVKEAIDPNDPFAEWEKANARLDTRRKAERIEAVEEPVRKAEPKPVEKKPAPAARPAAKPAAKPVTEEFSLDDILNEFK